MITKDMLISDALRQGNIDAMAEVLYNFGMHCLGCALARGETIEQAAAVHGVDPEEMVKALNEAAKTK
jgi:hybrid cluster-associated redox disulfide protein